MIIIRANVAQSIEKAFNIVSSIGSTATVHPSSIHNVFTSRDCRRFITLPAWPSGPGLRRVRRPVAKRKQAGSFLGPGLSSVMAQGALGF